MKNLFTVGVITAVLLLVAGYFYSKYRVAPKIDFATLQLTDLAGQKVELSQFSGRPLFINFFATWCGPCMAEMLPLKKAAVELRNEGFVFVCISDEPVERLNYLKDRLSGGISILHSEIALKDLDVYTVPTNYLLNSKGAIVFKNTGIKNWDDPSVLKELKSDVGL